MEARTYHTSQVVLGRLTKGDDLLAGIESLCRTHKVRCGLIQILGSLSGATLAFYDQIGKAYRTFHVDTPLEIVSGLGNVSLKGGKLFCHVHLVVADCRGACYGGHLVPGSAVFAAEVHLQALAGEPPIRRADESTGLYLWRFQE